MPPPPRCVAQECLVVRLEKPRTAADTHECTPGLLVEVAYSDTARATWVAMRRAADPRARVGGSSARSLARSSRVLHARVRARRSSAPCTIHHARVVFSAHTRTPAGRRVLEVHGGLTPGSRFVETRHVSNQGRACASVTKGKGVKWPGHFRLLPRPV